MHQSRTLTAWVRAQVFGPAGARPPDGAAAARGGARAAVREPWTLTACAHAQVFVGLLARDHLMVLLRRVMARGLPRANADAAQDDIAFEDLSRHFVSAAARSLILEQQLAVLQVRAPDMQESVAQRVSAWCYGGTAPARQAWPRSSMYFLCTLTQHFL